MGVQVSRNLFPGKVPFNPKVIFVTFFKYLINHIVLPTFLPIKNNRYRQGYLSEYEYHQQKNMEITQDFDWCLRKYI